MKLAIFTVIIIYFLIGGIGIFFINRKTNNAKEKSNRWVKYAVYFLIVTAITGSLLYKTGFQYLAIIIVVLGFYELVLVWRKTAPRENFILLTALFLFALIGFGFIKFAFLADDRILFVYVLVFTFDGFSQITGQLIGRHKLTPQLSPNKTWEGLAGGYLITLVTALIIGPWFNFTFLAIIGYTFLICTTALLGDLAASWYKRICHVKDYSNLIPGHGGVLDRFDSFLAAGAVNWLVSLII